MLTSKKIADLFRPNLPPGSACASCARFMASTCWRVRGGRKVETIGGKMRVTDCSEHRPLKQQPETK